MKYILIELGSLPCSAASQTAYTLYRNLLDCKLVLLVSSTDCMFQKDVCLVASVVLAELVCRRTGVISPIIAMMCIRQGCCLFTDCTFSWLC